jgi:hypothetical protein
MIANNCGVNQVWRYTGAGTNWTPITGTNTSPKKIQAIGDVLYMVTITNNVNQVWEYTGTGTHWTLVPDYSGGP